MLLWAAMTHDAEHPPGATAPVTGLYRLLNVFGNPMEHSVHVRRGQPLPHAPVGQGWRLEQETDDDE
jgi:hypothetical protein